MYWLAIAIAATETNTFNMLQASIGRAPKIDDLGTFVGASQ
jgi:hypothetical protein